ncbi:MAG: hypothetical protein OXU63_08555 [Acidobacteriota bacterium]|nr:hypothetical protein [Acidobacteriota bacterium]
MTTRHLTKAACAGLRADLRDLGYGQAESEASTLFAQRLYPVPQHLRALDPTVVLVVGARGAGKSELFRAFFKEDAEGLGPAILDRVAAEMRTAPALGRSTWINGYPAGIDFPDSDALTREIDTEERAKELWRLMLLRRLRAHLDPERLSKLGPVLEPMAADLGEVFKGAGVLTANPTAALDELEIRLGQEDRWLFVGYDELDTLGGFDWALNSRLVRGLVAFWSDYSRRWHRIRAKVFLRSDLFRRHAGMATADFAKLAANRVELSWPDAAILGMLVKRIANTSADLAAYCRQARIEFDQDDRLGLVPRVDSPEQVRPLIERMAGEFMGANRKKGLVRNWVFDHLRDGVGAVSPRNFVRLFELSAGKESANQTLRPPRLLHPTALRQALEDVSDDHVRQGVTSEWPWLDGVRRRLRLDPLAPWTRRRIVELLDSDEVDGWAAAGAGDVRPPEEDPAALLEYLVELGILRRRADDRLDVPDPYLYGLGLRRKGGVKVGRRPKRGGR